QQRRGRSGRRQALGIEGNGGQYHRRGVGQVPVLAAADECIVLPDVDQDARILRGVIGQRARQEVGTLRGQAGPVVVRGAHARIVRRPGQKLPGGRGRRVRQVCIEG